MLTVERLKELLHYDQDTGVFTWLVGRNWGVKAGAVAGYTNHGGYIVIRVDGQDCRAHRLAALYVEGEWPPDQIDHINGVRDDNKWINLRHATDRVQSRNQKRPSTNTSGVTGVYGREGHWGARIKVEGTDTYLGTFDTFDEAVAARKAADVEHDFHPNHGR